jgi:hypothetical protein
VQREIPPTAASLSNQSVIHRTLRQSIATAVNKAALLPVTMPDPSKKSRGTRSFASYLSFTRYILLSLMMFTCSYKSLLALQDYDEETRKTIYKGLHGNQKPGFMVLGMHRSGTSMLSGLLAQGFGYETGDPRDMGGHLFGASVSITLFIICWIPFLFCAHFDLLLYYVMTTLSPKTQHYQSMHTIYNAYHTQ